MDAILRYQITSLCEAVHDRVSKERDPPTVFVSCEPFVLCGLKVLCILPEMYN